MANDKSVYITDFMDLDRFSTSSHIPTIVVLEASRTQNMGLPDKASRRVFVPLDSAALEFGPHWAYGKSMYCAEST